MRIIGKKQENVLNRSPGDPVRRDSTSGTILLLGQFMSSTSGTILNQVKPKDRHEIAAFLVLYSTKFRKQMHNCYSCLDILSCLNWFTVFMYCREAECNCFKSHVQNGSGACIELYTQESNHSLLLIDESQNRQTKSSSPYQSVSAENMNLAVYTNYVHTSTLNKKS